MAIELERAGFDSYLILERAGEVGGTWRDNVYPGCACDIPSSLYSFSFERNPDWSRAFPAQPELLEYLKGCADRYGIRPHIRFQTAVTQARYDEARARWLVETSNGNAIECRVLIDATGALSQPRLPDMKGRERFEGRSFHSGQWDTSVDLRGRRVAVIGTGASAIQIVPALAPSVAQLTLFARTPPWIVPRGDAPVPKWHRTLQRRLPAYARLFRGAIYWLLEARALGFVVRRDLLAIAERVAGKHLERQVPDPELRRRLTPTYRLGCKRVLVSDDFYPALSRPNVAYVTDPIAVIEERGIVTQDGKLHPFDVIVFATGFDATGNLPMNVYGRNGVELNASWSSGMEAYLGISVAGFPNYFKIIGPNTGLGHNSMIVMMEAQFRYAIDALKTMRQHGIAAVDVRRDVQRRFNDSLQSRMGRTVWMSGCNSWYLDQRGRNTTLWPGFSYSFTRATRRFRLDRYETIRPGTH